MASGEARFGIATALALGLAAGGSACGSRGAERPVDVVLITLDTFRADHLGSTGHPRVQTPNLDALAAEGVLFESAFTPVPSTLPSHASILTGCYPAFHGIHDNGLYVLEPERVTLTERLRAEGYATGAVVGAFVLDPQFGLDQGFEVYDAETTEPLLAGEAPDSNGASDAPAEDEGRRRWQAQVTSSYQRRADAVTDRAVEWLDTVGERPFFLWAHYFDAHAPYQAPGEDGTRYDPDYTGPMDGDARTFWRELERRAAAEPGAEARQLMAREIEHMRARYEGEVTYVDRELGRLFTALRERGRWNRTLVIVVGDHGEAFGEHWQMFEHNGEAYDEVLRVPLILRLPDREQAGRRVGELVRTLDVAPTVLERLGLEPLAEAQGDPLTPLLDGSGDPKPRVVLFEALRERQVSPMPFSWLGLRTAQEKVLLMLDAQGAIAAARIFDLAPDPGEQDAAECGEERVGHVLMRHRRLRLARGALPLRDLDELSSRALRELGYTGD